MSFAWPFKLMKIGSYGNNCAFFLFSWPSFPNESQCLKVHTLRDQLGQEARSRRTFIASSQAISQDVTEIRRQLDQSLDMVGTAELGAGLLGREASRLQDTSGRYSGVADYSRINRYQYQNLLGLTGERAWTTVDSVRKI